MQTPEEERFLMDRDEIYAELRILLGGRAAEKVAFNTMTTGASNDIGARHRPGPQNDYHVRYER